MAKQVFQTVYAVAVGTGVSSTGNKYLTVNCSYNSDSKNGALKFISEYSDMYQTIMDALDEQGIEISFEEDKRNRYALNEAIPLGQGCIFEETNVPIVIQVRQLEDGTERRTPLTSVRGVALSDSGESVRGLVEREMIRRCNNRDQFMPVKGQDYSRFFYAETTWEEIAKALFPDEDAETASDEDGEE